MHMAVFAYVSASRSWWPYRCATMARHVAIAAS